MRYKPILYKNIINKNSSPIFKRKNKMSEISNGILGKMTGSIGNITGKVRNGKNILALKPASFTASNDPASIARREKFRQTVKFAKVVNAQAPLKALWQKVTPPDLSSFNYIVKVNYPSFLDGSFSGSTTITPLLGFPVVASASELTQNGISFTVNSLANAYDFNLIKETKLKPIVLLSFSAPGNTALDASQFVPTELPVSTFVANSEITFETTFNDYIKSLFENYSSRSALLALVTFDDNNSPVNYSQTFVI